MDSGETLHRPIPFIAPDGTLLKRRELFFAAAIYPIALLVSALIGSVPLPFDRQFGLVITLMWCGTKASVSRLQYYVFYTNEAICFAGIAILLMTAVVPARMLSGNPRFLVRRVYRYAVALPLFYLMTVHLSRYTASLAYVLERYVHWDLTPAIARLETPMIEWIQRALVGPLSSVFFSTIYSFAWSIAILLTGLGLVLADRPQLLNRAITGFFLISLLAVPFYVLLPVYDPWTTNPIYGNPGAFSTHIQYLYPSANPFVLRYIATDYNKWATAYCLPSLHVALPLMFYFITRRGGLKIFSYIFLALSVFVGFAILYLGRHWLVDALIAVPFAYGVARLTETLRVDFSLGGAADPSTDAL